MVTKEALILFETKAKEAFLAGEIRAPVHLSGGNEEQLLNIFQDVKPGDWVCSTHRSHYHALLKGIPEEWVMTEILAGRSIHLFNKEHRFISSAIVGGCLPIAVGIALGIKRQGGGERVWVFVGDMAATTGIFYESVRYADGWDLPVVFVVEDNGLSVDTPTCKTWNNHRVPFYSRKMVKYGYRRVYPHINVGEWVVFK